MREWHMEWGRLPLSVPWCPIGWSTTELNARKSSILVDGEVYQKPVGSSISRCEFPIALLSIIMTCTLLD